MEEVMALLARVVRSGFDECEHSGSLVAIDSDGSILFSVGEPSWPMFPRSSNKPIQAVGMVRAGLDLPPDLLAMAGASHSGEDVHVSQVERILAGAGLTDAALQCPPSYPMDEASHNRMIEEHRGPDRVHMNCSGKHSAMLATCVAAGWPVETYLDPEHPLQQVLGATVAELADEPVAAIGVDGCGAPIFGISVLGLARAFSAIATGAPGSAEQRVADAFRANPILTSGSTRDERFLVEGLPGTLAKAGAEGCYAVALPDGRAVALKIGDGAERARSVVMAEALHRLGVDAPVVTAQLRTPVLGGGHEVGEIVAAGW
jgi:L-asparaginase II